MREPETLLSLTKPSQATHLEEEDISYIGLAQPFVSSLKLSTRSEH